MPSVPLHLPDPDRGTAVSSGGNPLPHLLQTPSGLAILELQGTINIPSTTDEAAEGSDLPNPMTTVGRLEFPDYHPNDPTGSTSWMKRVHLYVGRHQRLTGEVKKLPNPLGVIRRKLSDEEALATSSGKTEELEIMEIIYYKRALYFTAYNFTKTIKGLTTTGACCNPAKSPEMAFIQEAVVDTMTWSFSMACYATIASVSIFTIWAICVSIRNIYFHPLSKFAGPRSAAATPIPFAFNLVRGSMVNWVMALHAKYGPIVRISPDELSFIAPSSWQEIYTARPQLPKVDKAVFQTCNGVPSIAAQVDPAEHTRQRRILNHAFSERALREQESILKVYTDLLITQLQEQVDRIEKPSVTLDITKWYNFTTFDTIGDLLFNDPFHSLEDSTDHPWVAAIFDGLKFGVLITAFQYFPPLPTVVNYLMPRSIIEAANQNFMWTREKITRRIQTKTDRPDFMTYILGNNEGEGKMTRDEIDSTGWLLILAGSETSATTSSSSTFFFLKNTAVYERLKKEVRSAFESANDITIQSAAQLPYLHAVISEALRLHPPGPVSVPRMVDRPGVVIDGHEVPIGTRVGIPQKTMFRSPSNFVEPNTYAPERWLPDADPKYDADRKGAYEPFMVGPRNCPGKRLAWAEMNLILCKMLWNFDMELAEGNNDDWSMEQKVFLLHERTPLYVKLTPRS